MEGPLYEGTNYYIVHVICHKHSIFVNNLLTL